MVKTISKNTINTIRQLHAAKHRNETGLFIVEGVKIIHELLQSDFKIRLIACLSEYFEYNSTRLANYDVNLVNENDLSRISLMQTPNQILALVEIPQEIDLNFETKGVYLMLDGIRDPGNLGTMIRTAEWFGVKGIICSSDCVDAFTPKVVQGSMGSIFRMPVIYGELSEMIRKFRSTNSGNILGAVLGGVDLKELKATTDSSILVIGSEASGISTAVKELLDQKINITGAPETVTESLNAAVACGIILNVLSGK